MPDPFSRARVDLQQVIRDLFGVYDAMGGDERGDRDEWFREQRHEHLADRAPLRGMTEYARELARWINARLRPVSVGQDHR
jgi:hypothetical protein